MPTFLLGALIPIREIQKITGKRIRPNEISNTTPQGPAFYQIGRKTFAYIPTFSLLAVNLHLRGIQGWDKIAEKLNEICDNCLHEIRSPFASPLKISKFTYLGDYATVRKHLKSFFPERAFKPGVYERRTYVVDDLRDYIQTNCVFKPGRNHQS